MNLAEFHAQIARALRRGSSLNEVIPDITAEAALFLEQNYTFRYMERFGRVSVDPEADVPERIEVESQRIKSWNFVKAVWAEQASVEEFYWDLEEVSARDIVARVEGTPSGYYQDGDQFLILDNVPVEPLDLSLSWNEFTTWPTSDYENAEPRLLIIGSNVLKSQVLLQFAEENRDPRLVEIYQRRRDEGLSSLLRAEEEGKLNNRQFRMNYVPR